MVMVIILEHYNREIGALAPGPKIASFPAKRCERPTSKLSRRQSCANYYSKGFGRLDVLLDGGIEVAFSAAESLLAGTHG